jgi:hypothetical protein
MLNARAFMPSLPPKLLSLLAGIALAGWLRPAEAQRCGDGQLSLSATESLMLPATFGIQGVDATREGRLTLWSPAGELLMVDASRRLTTYQLPDTIAPVGVVPAGVDGFRLIDTRTGREMLARTTGTLESVGDDLRGPGEVIERAVPSGDGWILGLLDLGARQYVVRRVGPESSRTLFRSAAADSAIRIPRYNLTDASGSLLLTLGSSPFTVLRYDSASSGFRPLPAPLATQPTLLPADSLRTWRAVSTVALDCTLLLTLSDLTSDQRLLVRYGADDRVERITRVNAPIGLMARIPGAQTVLAARRAGELELVWYDWRWVREPGSAGH